MPYQQRGRAGSGGGDQDSKDTTLPNRAVQKLEFASDVHQNFADYEQGVTVGLAVGDGVDAVVGRRRVDLLRDAAVVVEAGDAAVLAVGDAHPAAVLERRHAVRHVESVRLQRLRLLYTKQRAAN